MLAGAAEGDPRMRVSFGTIALAAVLLVAASPAQAQAPEVPISRTADNRPDIQGVWESRWSTLLERPPGVTKLRLTDAEAPAFAAAGEAGRARRPPHSNPDSDFDLAGLVRIDGAYRTSLIVEPEDGRLPYTPEGRARRVGLSEITNDPEARLSNERCLGGPGRAPILSPPTNAFVQIIQPPGAVLLVSESMHETRFVTTDGIARMRGFSTFYGDSFARWEGDTLVIETRNMRAESRFSPPAAVVVITPATLVVERLTPISSRELRYSYTVTDPEVYARPWTVETTWLKSDKPLYEYACHEHNYSMVNMLKGTRVADARAAAKEKTPKR